MEYNFSKDLKAIREILGISQSEFADQIGVEQVTISRNELGRMNGRGVLYIKKQMLCRFQNASHLFFILLINLLMRFFIPYRNFCHRVKVYLDVISSAFLRSLAIIPFFSGFGTGALRKLLMLVM